MFDNFGMFNGMMLDAGAGAIAVVVSPLPGNSGRPQSALGTSPKKTTPVYPQTDSYDVNVIAKLRRKSLLGS